MSRSSYCTGPYLSIYTLAPGLLRSHDGAGRAIVDAHLRGRLICGFLPVFLSLELSFNWEPVAHEVHQCNIEILC